jgi:hypothetical protein
MGSSRAPLISRLAGVLSGVLLLAPSGARAFVREYVSTTPTSSSTCPDGLLPLFWPSRSISWEFFQDSQSSQTIEGDVPWSDALAAVNAGAQTWTHPTCTDLQLPYGGPTAQFTMPPYDPKAKDHINLVIFREKTCDDPTAVPAGSACLASDDCSETYNCWGNSSSGVDGVIALTTDTFDTSSGEVVQAIMEFNAAIDPQTGDPFNRFTVNDATTTCNPPNDPSQMDCVAIDVQNTATHEWGHFVGLAHTMVPNSTMNATAPPGETSKRTLGPDDIAGLCTIYPKGQETSNCAPPTPKKGCSCSADSASGVPPMLLALGKRRRRRSHRENL